MLIMTTQKCNLRCSHCMGSHTMSGVDMDFDTFKEVFNRLGSIDHNVVLTGGEPFLNKDLHKMVEWLIKKPWINQLIITSNGTLILSQHYNWVKRTLKKYYPRFRIQVTNDPAYYGVKIDLKSLQKIRVEVVDKMKGIMSLGRAKSNKLDTYGCDSAYCMNPIMMANQLTNFDDVNGALMKLKFACGFMVMPNMDIYLSECRKIRLANLQDDNWKETCWKRLTIEQPYQLGGILCADCGFDNRRAFAKLRNCA